MTMESRSNHEHTHRLDYGRYSYSGGQATYEFDEFVVFFVFSGNGPIHQAMLHQPSVTQQQPGTNNIQLLAVQ